MSVKWELNTDSWHLKTWNATTCSHFLYHDITTILTSLSASIMKFIGRFLASIIITTSKLSWHFLLLFDCPLHVLLNSLDGGTIIRQFPCVRHSNTGGWSISLGKYHKKYSICRPGKAWWIYLLNSRLCNSNSNRLYD